MSWEELVGELRKLSRVEKLRAMQILVTDLAADEDALLIDSTEYEVWSPYDAADAAETLLKMLEENRKSTHG